MQTYKQHLADWFEERSWYNIRVSRHQLQQLQFSAENRAVLFTGLSDTKYTPCIDKGPIPQMYVNVSDAVLGVFVCTEVLIANNLQRYFKRQISDTPSLIY